MKTIAITVDGVILERIDRLVASQGTGMKSRSAVVRLALREFVGRLEQAIEEDREREVIRRNRKRLGLEASALVREQARP